MQINLLPKQLKEKKAVSLELQDLRPLIVGFIFLWLALGGFWGFLRSEIRDCKKRLAKTEAGWKETEPLLKEKDRLLQQKKESGDFLAFMQEYFKKGLIWSEKLTSFSRLVPAEIWLEEISFQKEKRQKQEGAFLEVFAATDYAQSDEVMLKRINGFLEGLKNDSVFFNGFESLSLLDISKAKGKEGEKEMPMGFKFRLFLKNETKK